MIGKSRLHRAAFFVGGRGSVRAKSDVEPAWTVARAEPCPPLLDNENSRNNYIVSMNMSFCVRNE